MCQDASPPEQVCAIPGLPLAQLQLMAGSHQTCNWVKCNSPPLQFSTELSANSQNPHYLTSEHDFVLFAAVFHPSLSPGSFSPEGHPVLCGRNPALLLFYKSQQCSANFSCTTARSKNNKFVPKIHLFWLFPANCHGTLCSSAATSPMASS